MHLWGNEIYSSNEKKNKTMAVCVCGICTGSIRWFQVPSGFIEARSRRNLTDEFRVRIVNNALKGSEE